MRAILRGIGILSLGGWILFAAPALAQQETGAPPTTNTPATDAVGPRELQNFSLPGTNTKPADQPATATAPEPSAAAPETGPDAATSPAPVRSRSVSAAAPAQRETASATPKNIATGASAPAPALSPVPTPAISSVETPATVSQQQQQPVLPSIAAAPEHRLSLLPWITAALALAGGTIFFLWRRRPQQSLAVGPQIDLYTAPEPPALAPRWLTPEAEPEARQPATRVPPMPTPAAPTPAPIAPPAAPSGIIASRLRPALEIGVQPVRCIIGEDQVAIEFEVELFNAGTAPARAVLAEASLFNPGATQEQELAAFFQKPAGPGDRLDAIPPMRRIALTSQVVAPREAIQEYDLAGHKSFVPVIAFNAIYEWSGGQGQTSAAYLVGRDTGGDKLGPLRMDPAPREIRGLGARPLPALVKA